MANLRVLRKTRYFNSYRELAKELVVLADRSLEMSVAERADVSLEGGNHSSVSLDLAEELDQPIETLESAEDGVFLFSRGTLMLVPEGVLFFLL